eukprot:6489612-Prymnesium_polylepis.2
MEPHAAACRCGRRLLARHMVLRPYESSVCDRCRVGAARDLLLSVSTHSEKPRGPMAARLRR